MGESILSHIGQRDDAEPSLSIEEKERESVV